MGVKFGNKIIDKIYIGDREISNVYLGDKEIYTAFSIPEQFVDTSGSPGSPIPIADLDGNLMYSVEKGIAYYGTVSHTDLYTSTELSNLLNLTNGNICFNEDIWHKYYWNGGIHFWRRPIKESLNWNSIWSVGAVLGTGTTTSRRGYTVFDFNGPALSNINQDAEVSKNQVNYVVRLVEAFNADPGNNAGIFSIQNSEWSLVFYNLHVATNSGQYSPSPTNNISYQNWSNNPELIPSENLFGWKTNFGDDVFAVRTSPFNTRFKLSQETRNTSSTTRKQRGLYSFDDMNQRIVSISSTDTTRSFSPVLTVKHSSFATYGKTGGFNQNEPDW